MRVLTPNQLTETCIKIMLASGVPNDEAQTVANVLVEANLRGQDGHGALMLPRYLADVKTGRIKFPAKIEIVRESPSSALLNGNWGFGQVIGVKAMELAINKAKDHTIGFVGIYNCNHIGMLSHYSMMALNHDMIGFTACNSNPEVAPYGGRARQLGTNPVCYAIPAGNEKPIVLDMATSVVAAGKIRDKYAKGEKTPEGWMIDSDGRGTVDPTAFVTPKGSARAMLLPIGGYKGYGLSLIVDALGGALTGSGCCSTDKKGGHRENGVIMFALKIDSFTEIAAFKQRIDDEIRSIKSTPTAPGFEEILISGEPEFRTAEERSRKGIEIPDATWEALKEAGKEAGVDIE